MQTRQSEFWTAGEAYEAYVGRWSRPVARQFLAWLGVFEGARWLDVGCGTGSLTQVILEDAAPRQVVGVDPSESFITYARAKHADAHVAFRIGNGTKLPIDDATFDVVVSGLVLNFMPDPALAVAEIARVTSRGGRIAAYVWDYAGGMQFMRHFWDVAIALDASALPLDEGRRFPICRLDSLTELFAAARLNGVETRAIDIPTVFKGFDDYWVPFLGGQGPAPHYCMSLPESHRSDLRARLAATLPRDSDGTIHLMARAWAVRGRRI